MNVKLEIVRGQPQGKCLVFPQGEFVIGRGSECHIRPNSSWVSRQHCLLRITDHSVCLRDLGSTNGTLINGTRVIGERLLTHGDEIQVGPLVFAVQLEEPAPGKPTNAQSDTDVHCLDTSEAKALRGDQADNSPSQAATKVGESSFTIPSI